MEVVALTAGIVGATCAVINAIVGVRDLKRDYHAKRDRKESSGKEARASFFSDEVKTLSYTLNDVSSALGRSLPEELDSQFIDRVQALRPKIKIVLEELEKLKLSTSPNPMARKNKATTRAEIPELEKLALGLKESLQEAISDFRTRFSSRRGKEKQAMLSTFVELSGTKFCYGAILCQNGRATAASLAISETSPSEQPRWGFICQYCNLEVGDYKTILLSSSGKALETSDLLASCHVMACDELDLRAYYKCLVCYLSQRDHAFTTASDFEAHMVKHEVLPAILERPISASSQAAQKDIDKFLRNEFPNSALKNMLESEPGDQNSPVLDIESDDGEVSDNSLHDEFVSPPRSSTNSPFDSQTTRIDESNSPWVASAFRFPPVSQESTAVDHLAVDATSDVAELDTSLGRKGWELPGSPVSRNSPIELPVPDTSNPILEEPPIELPVPGSFVSTK